MLNGFVANSYEEELPNKRLFVSFMIEQRDVTAYLDSLGLNKQPEGKRYHFVDSIENAMQKDIQLRDIVIAQAASTDSSLGDKVRVCLIARLPGDEEMLFSRQEIAEERARQEQFYRQYDSND